MTQLNATLQAGTGGGEAGCLRARASEQLGGSFVEKYGEPGQADATTSCEFNEAWQSEDPGLDNQLGAARAGTPCAVPPPSTRARFRQGSLNASAGITSDVNARHLTHRPGSMDSTQPGPMWDAGLDDRRGVGYGQRKAPGL